jgi:hypothetical protein
MNIISLDKSQPDIAAALEGCEVGVPKSLTITVTPVTDSDGLFVARVDEVAYSEEEVVEEEVAEEPAEAAYRPTKGKTATAVEPVI